MNVRFFLALLLPVNVGLASFCDWKPINKMLVLFHSGALLVLAIAALIREVRCDAGE